MAGLSGNWLKEGAAGAGVEGFGGVEVMRDYPGLGWGLVVDAEPDVHGPTESEKPPLLRDPCCVDAESGCLDHASE
jgi:hypothetical protein